MIIPRLEARDLEALSGWQRENLQVQWCVADQPWVLEKAVIAEMQPQMNLEHNSDHQLHASMSRACAQFKAEAERFRDQA